MYLFKSFLALLVTVSMLTGPIPADTPTSTIVYSSHQTQPFVKATSQHMDNWKVSQIDLTNANSQLLDTVKTFWN